MTHWALKSGYKAKLVYKTMNETVDVLWIRKMILSPVPTTASCARRGITAFATGSVASPIVDRRVQSQVVCTKE